MDRDPDGPGLVRQCPTDRLPDPPGGIGRELVALGVVELLDRADQTEVALLDQVEQGHAATAVLLGDRDHKTQVRRDQLLFRRMPVPDQGLEVTPQYRLQVGVGLQLVLGEQASLDPLGQFDFLRGVEQGYFADLAQVHTHEVGGSGMLRGCAGSRRSTCWLLLVEDLDAEGGQPGNQDGK